MGAGPATRLGRSAHVQAFLRRFAIALVVVFGITSWGIAYGYWFIDESVNNNVARTPVSTRRAIDGKPVNYLIIGSDSRSFVKTSKQAEQFGSAQGEAGQRSDTMMVAHLDPKSQTTLLVSFPRDLWVNIPGHGSAKLNAAFNYGPQTVIDTLQQNFNIPINHYLEVNFTGFEGIVDAVGAVDLWFPTIARDTYTGLNVTAPGCVAVNGKRALQYVRSRHYEYKNTPTGRWHEDPRADIGRIARQQYFIRSLAATAISKGVRDLGTARTLINRGLRSLTADQNLNSGELLDLASAFRKTQPGEMRMETVPGDVGRMNSQSVLLLRTKQAAPLFALLRSQGTTTPTTEKVTTKVRPSTVTVKVLNGSGSKGIAKSTATALAAKGFRTTGTGNAVRNDFPLTQVRYGTGDGAKDAAQTVAAYLGGVGAVQLDESIIDSTVTVILGSDFVGVAEPGKTAKPVTSSSSTTPANPTGKTGIAAAVPGATAVGCPK